MLVLTMLKRKALIIQIRKVKFAARVRLNMDAKVNKNTSVKARLTTGSIEFGDAAKDHTMSF